MPVWATPNRTPFVPPECWYRCRGIAGLYAAVLLQSNVHRVRVFNGTDLLVAMFTLTTSRKNINTSKPAQFTFPLEIP
jgi:hypothetical protein